MTYSYKGIFENTQFLNEKTEFSAKWDTFFTKAMGIIKGEDWTKEKLKKAIKEIEECNRRIAEYNKTPRDPKVEQNLGDDKIYTEKVTKECLWMCAKTLTPLWGGAALGLAVGSGIGAIVGTIVGWAVAIFFINTAKDPYNSRKENGDVDRFFGKLESENNKALKYLKSELKKMD